MEISMVFNLQESHVYDYPNEIKIDFNVLSRGEKGGTYYR